MRVKTVWTTEDLDITADAVALEAQDHFMAFRRLMHPGMRWGSWVERMPGSRFPRQERIDFYHRLFARLSALPGVQSVSAGFPLPLSGNNIDIDIAIEGRPVASGDQPSEKLALVHAGFLPDLADSDPRRPGFLRPRTARLRNR